MRILKLMRHLMVYCRINRMQLVKTKSGFVSAESLFHLSCTKAQNHLGLKYSQKQLFIAIWKNIWTTVGLYYHGLSRIPIWVSVQLNLLRKSIKSFREEKQNLVLEARLLQETKSYLSEAQSQFVKTRDYPLVSIIMPIWNRVEFVKTAIASVLNQIYMHWELIIIDDGSTDGTKAAIEEVCLDSRIHYYYQAHSGVCVARNLGIEKSKGTLIAYLDSDNTWLPHYLLLMVNALLKDPSLQGVYSALLWHSAANKKRVYYPETLSYQEAILQKKDNSFCGVDINTFMHRRDLIDRLGDFDTSLSRLTDYELTFRYLLHANIKSIPILGTKYFYCLTKNAISRVENVWHNIFLIREKYAKLSGQAPLRVLYLFNKKSAQIEVELEYLKRKNIQVEVWDGQCSLNESLQSFHPHVIHTHEFSQALAYAEELHHHPLQLTVYETNEVSQEFILKLNAHPAIASIYVPKEIYQENYHLSKVKAMLPCFNPKLYFPNKNKHRKRVLYVVSKHQQLKALDAFIRIAAKCKNHEFMLIVPSFMHHALSNLISMNETYGQPVRIRALDNENDMVTLMTQAGIYLDTNTVHASVSAALPLSVYEAMATGSYVVTHRHHLVDVINEISYVYATEDEAVDLINDTLTWPDEKWYEVQRKFIDKAYQYFVDDRVLSTLIDDWQTIQSKTSYLTKQ